MTDIKKVLVTGGLGFVGSRLVPKLVGAGKSVDIMDFVAFDQGQLQQVVKESDVELIEADIRDEAKTRHLFERKSYDAVIHLAAISNDPSSKLDPVLTTSVNRDGVQQLMRLAKEAGVDRLIYASSASVYGIKEDVDVTESLSLEPLTLYAKYKADGEDYLNDLTDKQFCGVSVRAATVCGYSPRLRLDLVVNLLTAHALTKGHIRVFGGDQMRPHIHVDDLTDAYLQLLERPAEQINGEAFNIVRDNLSVMNLAELIQQTLSVEVPIEVEESYDERSYRLSDKKMREHLGFEPTRSIEQAINELEAAYRNGRFESFDNPRCHNVDWMQKNPELWAFDDEKYHLSEES